MSTLTELGAKAKNAARVLAVCPTDRKNSALEAIAQALAARLPELLAANALDLAQAREAGMSQAMLDRLTLDEARIAGMIEGVRQVQALEDPIGQVLSMVKRPNGLLIGRRRVPLGVVGIIYEARPNVTVDAAVLCLKTGNAVILRGGREAIESNRALVSLMRQAVESEGISPDAVCLVTDTARESAVEMMGLSGYIDVLIPRGGAGLIRSVVENARVPVIETGVGNCHVFIDAGADLDMGARILFNAKCSRPSVCNAAETLLVDRSVAQAFLPEVKKLLDTKNVELRGCEET